MFPSYPWQLVVGPFFAAMGVYIVIFLFRELPTPRLKELVALAIGLFIIAIAMDFVEGMEDEPLDRLADTLSVDAGRLVHFSKSVEEFLEMLGTSMFLFVFLKKLVGLTPTVAFELTSRRPNP